MDSLACIILFLLAFHTHSSATADRKFGCLFEDELCTPYEICVNDRLFGRCQRVPVIDVYRYEVSPPVLQSLRSLLHKLSHRGLTWQDDTTQQVISKELSKLQKIYYRRPDSSSTDTNNQPRAGSQGVDSGKNDGKNGEANLGKSLQQYLQYLGFVPQSTAQTNQKAKNEKPPVKSDAIQADHFIDYIRQKSKTRGKAPPSIFSLAPSLQTQYPDNTTPPRPFVPFQLERAPAQLGAVDFPSKQSIASKALLSTLEGYLAKKIAAQQTHNAAPDVQPKGPLVYNSQLRQPTTSQLESMSPSEDVDSYKGKKPLQPKPDSRPQRPQSDRLTYKTGLKQETAKDPLSFMDESFIENVVKQLGKHSVNIDGLSPKELDQLADVIADALQVVDQGDTNPQEMKRVSAPGMEEYENDMIGEDDMMQERQLEENNQVPTEKDKSLVAKLIQYLDKTASTEAPELDSVLAESHDKETETSEASEEPVVEKKEIGVENVRSKTTLKYLSMEKKKLGEEDSKEAAELQRWIQEAVEPANSIYAKPHKKDMKFEEELRLDVESGGEEQYGYIVTDKGTLDTDTGLHLMEVLAHHLKLQMKDFVDIEVLGPAVTFIVRSNPQNLTTADVANAAVAQKEKLEKETGVKILQAGMGDKSTLKLLPLRSEKEDSTKFLVLTVITIVCIIGILAGSGVVYCLRHRSHHKLKEKLTGLGSDAGSDATAAYQELCRQHMAVKTAERPEPHHTSRINSASSQFSDGPIPSPTARSSTSSWSEEPVQSNMNISTGHMVLSYMEDHLKNKNRLEKEWEALCAYQAEPNAATVAQRAENAKKNRTDKVPVYDHSRITLKVENNRGNSDYINASPIMDHDPKSPAYIATQGPLPSTVADFWQMVWENGCVVIVMLTPLTENGVKQCYHYWPDEGSNLYNIYEVNLVSEHIWCEDFLVRSFYLKNLQTNETRTVTQFHFLSWMNQSVPESTRSLLDFRRKVNKCYRGRSCPIIVHCSDGAGRSGTYILIDMVLNKMAKGAKEIDIAATLEHLRDQRPGMVQTKEQFEFALTAVAEEVNAILKALPQ
ncbi:receptor-type tyrosine-protein phosphatase N2-like isoform X1 [Acipenser ruthenus]|uniref:receptor-type tyrosine-protein phosphatase N2-like isoform X1 n=1 Tax=Acipenser ruthenus TaxID=7906 RepID=UPI00145A7F77|nr:receptor-type tyrosine-protein phosphatase N2-like isoform X1 [Acipenser ruthenus]